MPQFQRFYLLAIHRVPVALGFFVRVAWCRMSSSDHETPRGIALLRLTILLLVVLGFVALAVVMKMNGYGTPNAVAVRWSPIAVTLRQQGQWGLVIPLLWAGFAVVAARVDRGIFSEWIAWGAGGLIILAIVMIYGWAIAAPYTRPVLLYLGPNTSTAIQSNK